jgi:hypothetical protein
MPLEFFDLAAAGQIPEPQRVVPTTRQRGLAVRGNGNRIDRARMPKLWDDFDSGLLLSVCSAGCGQRDAQNKKRKSQEHPGPPSRLSLDPSRGPFIRNRYSAVPGADSHVRWCKSEEGVFLGRQKRRLLGNPGPNGSAHLSIERTRSTWPALLSGIGFALHDGVRLGWLPLCLYPKTRPMRRNAEDRSVPHPHAGAHRAWNTRYGKKAEEEALSAS